MRKNLEFFYVESEIAKDAKYGGLLSVLSTSISYPRLLELTDKNGEALSILKVWNGESGNLFIPTKYLKAANWSDKKARITYQTHHQKCMVCNQSPLHKNYYDNTIYCQEKTHTVTYFLGADGYYVTSFEIIYLDTLKITANFSSKKIEVFINTTNIPKYTTFTDIDHLEKIIMYYINTINENIFII